MKVFGVSFLILLIVIAGWFFLFNTDKSDDGEKLSSLKTDKNVSLRTEQFIIDHLLAENGTIRTDFKQNPKGKEALSESIGLWMEYLVEKDDSELFEKAFITVKEQFLSKENLIMWEIKDSELAQTNALIDDLRIIEALFTVGEREDRKDYIRLAKSISKSVVKYNRQGPYFIDFYDASHDYANEEITLSYLIHGPFEYMKKYKVISRKELEDIYSFVETIQVDSVFFAETYNVIKDVFYEDDIVNLIDQLYTAIHMERFDVETDEFYAWLKETFYQEKVLFGRYERQSKEEAVDYEAPAVYALAIMYSMEREDHTFAADLYLQMATMQTQDSESTYFGGYVSKGTTHSFDNLLPLIAERKLRNEQVIQ